MVVIATLVVPNMDPMLPIMQHNNISWIDYGCRQPDTSNFILLICLSVNPPASGCTRSSPA